ncbi:ribonuclease P protein component [Denitratisoma sp. DHT3]|uniref:ribonuclease P protein component n=1 Tax=Denitratisoma sp. DHT3 TaxID=1981880 RepID=UPI0011984AA1|nr:ribonuclease P protein component [Denitratisoma sp. DHT3]QDX81957.1 ribonuclease P protein component [Denitratisoma sp. DHT3]
MAGEYRFRPEHRLRQAGEFGAVFAYRRVLRGVRFDLHYRPNLLDSPRLGLVVPKRNARRAVQRNAIKRVVRELFRSQRSRLPAYDLIFRLARPSQTPDDRVLWKDEIEALLGRLPRNGST